MCAAATGRPCVVGRWDPVAQPQLAARVCVCTVTAVRACDCPSAPVAPLAWPRVPALHRAASAGQPADRLFAPRLRTRRRPAQVLVTLNEAFCERHRRACPPSDELERECGKVSSGDWCLLWSAAAILFQAVLRLRCSAPSGPGVYLSTQSASLLSNQIKSAARMQRPTACPARLARLASMAPFLGVGCRPTAAPASKPWAIALPSMLHRRRPLLRSCERRMRACLHCRQTLRLHSGRCPHLLSRMRHRRRQRQRMKTQRQQRQVGETPQSGGARRRQQMAAAVGGRQRQQRHQGSRGRPRKQIDRGRRVCRTLSCDPSQLLALHRGV